jgi:hypothetical protein
MEFIHKQSRLFNNLIYNYFFKKYNSIYKSRNTFILHNKNLNSHYKINLDENKHSLIYVLYKNIYYKEASHENQLNCYLDSNTKSKIIKTFNYYNKKIHLSNDVIIIGKRYINRKTNDKTNDSTKLYCTLKMPNEHEIIKNEIIKNEIIENEIIENENDVKDVENIQILEKRDKIYHNHLENQRRLFLYNLKHAFKSSNTLYINNTIKNGLFLDVEYTNDIYDDFKSFPVSKDHSMLFMIGITFTNYKNKNEIDYVHYTVDKLTPEYEYKILKEFLNYINEKYKREKNPIVIYHWSPADKTCIEKAFKKYPDLYNIYIIYPIEYIDLLLVVKQTIKLPCYSLKYVAKTLLYINYDTECKNGLDAMCSIIQKNISMNENEKLIDFDITKDVIEYNKMDTVLLYKVIMYFLHKNV